MAGGVEVKAIVQDDDPRLVFDPAHPDADAGGFVACPNVDMILQQQTFIERPVAARRPAWGYSSSEAFGVNRRARWPVPYTWTVTLSGPLLNVSRRTGRGRT